MRAARTYAALATATLILDLFPHLHFFIKRGADWQGTFPLTRGDFTLYRVRLR